MLWLRFCLAVRHYRAFSFLREIDYHQNVAFLQLLYFKTGLAGTNRTGNRRKMFRSHQSFAAFDWPVPATLEWSISGLKWIYKTKGTK